MTFLAILAHDAIALPLSHSFPASELRYLLENSEAKLLLSTSRFAAKAEEVLKEGLRQKPVLSITSELDRASTADNDDIDLDGTPSGLGGFMLYTSGTTSRPVRCNGLHRETGYQTDMLAERCAVDYVGHHSTGYVLDRSMEIYKG